MLPLERKKLSKTDVTVFFYPLPRSIFAITSVDLNSNSFVGISSLTVVRMQGVA